MVSILYWAFFALAVIDDYCATRQVTVRKSKLDIVFAFDQSGSLDKSDWKNVYKGIKQWTEFFFRDVNRSSEAQLAVVGMHDNSTPVLFTQDKTKIFDAIDKIIENYGGGNNMVLAAKRIQDEVFKTENKDRPDVPNIIFFISDCKMHNESGDSAIVNLHSVSKLFMFVCMETSRDDAIAHLFVESPERLLRWANNDTKNIYNYTNYVEFQKYIDQLLEGLGETEEIQVQDCEFQEVKGCEVNDTKWFCSNSSKVKVHPDKSGYANECPANDTWECSEEDCSKIIAENANKEEGGHTATKSSNLGVIIGASIGAVLLLLLLLLLLLFLVRRRRQQKDQKKTAKGDTIGEVKGREHNQGVKADISVMPTVFGGKKSSKKMAAGKQGASITAKSGTQSKKTGKAGPPKSKKTAKK